MFLSINLKCFAAWLNMKNTLFKNHNEKEEHQTSGKYLLI